MKSIIRATAILGALGTVGACASQPSPSVRAADVAQIACPTTSMQSWEDARLIRDTRFVEMQPVTAPVGGNSHGVTRIQGVKAMVQAPNGTPTADLTRAFQCKNARAVLGQTSDTSPAAEPFYLPDTWISLDVEPQQHGLYSVTASATRIDDNLALVQRAKEYAGAHGVAVSGDMP
jgi:hypothetical protein